MHLSYIFRFCFVALVMRDNSNSNSGADDILKRALLEQQDLSPSVHQNMLQQTTDQDIDDAFVTLEPPFDMDEYIFGPSTTGGLADLFDAYDIGI